MKNTQEKICRLCFTSVVNGFKDVDSDEKDMIEIVLPDLDLNIFGDGILCCQCSNNLLQAFAFKSSCLEIEDNIHNYTCDGHVQVNLEKLLGLNDMDKDNESMKIGNMRICRTCLDIVELEAFTRLDGYENHLVIQMLRKSLPELDCQLTINPGICDKCKHLASSTSDFISQCMDLEAKISEYVKLESPETFSIYNAFKHVFSEKESVFLLNSDVIILNQETDEIDFYKDNSKNYDMCCDSEEIIKSSDRIVSYDAERNELCDSEEIIKSIEDEIEDSDFSDDDSAQNSLDFQSENNNNFQLNENKTNNKTTEANRRKSTIETPLANETPSVDETIEVNETLSVDEIPLVNETTEVDKTTELNEAIEANDATKANDTTEANKITGANETPEAYDKITEANDITRKVNDNPREDDKMNTNDGLPEKSQDISEPSTSSIIENTPSVDIEISMNKRKYDSSDDVYIYEDNIDTIRMRQQAENKTIKPRRYNTRRSCRSATKILDLNDSSIDPDFVPDELTISDIDDEFLDPSGLDHRLAQKRRSRRERRKKQKKGTSQPEKNVNNNVYFIFPNGSNIQDTHPMFQIMMTPTITSGAPNPLAYSTSDSIPVPFGPSILESLLTGNSLAHINTSTRPQYIMSPSMTGTYLQQRTPSIQIAPRITPLCENNNAEALNSSTSKTSLQRESVVRQRTSVTSFEQTSYVTHNQSESKKSRSRRYVPNVLSNILSLNSNAKPTTSKKIVPPPTFSNRTVNQMNSINGNQSDTVNLTSINKVTKTINRKEKKNQTTPSPNITHIRNLPDIILNVLNESKMKQTENNTARNASTSPHLVSEQQISSNSNLSKTLMKKATKTTNQKSNESQTTPVQCTKRTNASFQQSPLLTSGSLSAMILKALNDLKMQQLANARSNTAQNTSTSVHKNSSIIVPAQQTPITDVDSVTLNTGDEMGTVRISEASAYGMSSNIESNQQTSSVTDVESVKSISEDALGTMTVPEATANQASTITEVSKSSEQQTPSFNDFDSITPNTDVELSTMEVSESSENQILSITADSEAPKQQTKSIVDVDSITLETGNALGCNAMEVSEASTDLISSEVSEVSKQQTPSFTDVDWVTSITGDALGRMNECESSTDQMSITEVEPENQTLSFTDFGDTLGRMEDTESAPNQISITEVSEASEQQTSLITNVGSITPNTGYALDKIEISETSANRLLSSTEVDDASDQQTLSITDVDSAIIGDSLGIELYESSEILISSIAEVSKTPEIQTSVTDVDTLTSIIGDGFGDTEDPPVTSLTIIQRSKASVESTSSVTDVSQLASIVSDHASVSEIDSVTSIFPNDNDDAQQTSSLMDADPGTVSEKPKQSTSSVTRVGPIALELTNNELEAMPDFETTALQIPPITGDDSATISICEKPDQSTLTTSVQDNSSVTDKLSITESELVAILNAIKDLRAISKQTEEKTKPPIIVADIDLTSGEDDAAVSQTPTENVLATSITDPTGLTSLLVASVAGDTSGVMALLLPLLEHTLATFQSPTKSTNINQAGARNPVNNYECALTKVSGISNNNMLVYNRFLLERHKANVPRKQPRSPAQTPLISDCRKVRGESNPKYTIISDTKRKPVQIRPKTGNETVISKTTTHPHVVIDTRGPKISPCADSVSRTQKFYCAYCKHVSTSSRKATKHYIKCVSRSKLCIPMECRLCDYKDTDKHLYKKHIKKCGKTKRDTAKGLPVIETIDLDEDPAPTQRKPEQAQAAGSESNKTQTTDSNLQSEQNELIIPNPEVPSESNGFAATAPDVHSEHNRLVPSEPEEHRELRGIAANERKNAIPDSKSFIKDKERSKGNKKLALGSESKVCSAQKGLVVLKCDLCSFNARTYENIEGHIQKDHIFGLKRDGVYQCNQCESCFMNLEDTAKHLKHSHQLDYYKIYYWCVKCATVFDKMSYLQNHFSSCSLKDKLVRLFKSNNNIFCLLCEFETDDVGKARSHLKSCRTKNIIVSDEVIEID